MKRRRLLAIGGATAGLAAAGAGTAWWLQRARADAYGPIHIKFSHVVAPDTPKGKACDYLARLVQTRSQGRVTMEIHPNSQLYRDKEELEALQLGSVQMVAPSLAKLGPLGINEFELFDLPFLFDSYDALRKVTNGEVGAQLLGRLESVGLQGLAFWDNGFKQMSANRPLVEPADFRGLRMRIQASEVLDAQMRALGAQPDSMAMSDMFAALENGVADGAENPASNFYTQRLYEVQKYLTLSNHGYLGYVVMVNRTFWSDLPGPVRELLQSCLAEATRFANEIAKSENDDAMERIRATGKTRLIELTPAQRDAWKDALAAVPAAFEKRAGSDLLAAARAAIAAPARG